MSLIRQNPANAETTPTGKINSFTSVINLWRRKNGKTR